MRLVFKFSVRALLAGSSQRPLVSSLSTATAPEAAGHARDFSLKVVDSAATCSAIAGRTASGLDREWATQGSMPLSPVRGPASGP
jgi:hypothetical protein